MMDESVPQTPTLRNIFTPKKITLVLMHQEIEICSHPSIVLVYRRLRAVGELEPVPAIVRRRYTLDKTIHTDTYGQFRVASSANMYVFGPRRCRSAWTETCSGIEPATFLLGGDSGSRCSNGVCSPSNLSF